jgi:hypothetical protein
MPASGILKSLFFISWQASICGIAPALAAVESLAMSNDY